MFKNGHKHSDETKRKIGLANSIALKGKHPKTEFKKGNHTKTEFKKGFSPWNKEKHTGIKPWLGKHRSEETKAKISKANKGQKRTEECIKKISDTHKGKKPYIMTKEIREKMSNSHNGKKNPWAKHFYGENHWNWKGGITPINKKIRGGIEFKLWRKSIFERDNFTCQKCGQRGGFLHPHHILNFFDHEDIRFAINNGITLCKKCHKFFHHKFGRKNNTREQLEEFLNNNI
jgi:hypothetical protein